MNLIVAVDKNWGIGSKNGLLYNIKQDMKFFRQTTLNKVVVMGRNTLESFPNGAPLKNRVNICINAEPDFVRDGVIVVYSLEGLFEEIKKYNSEDVFVIGGASIYAQLLPYCSKAYITKINAIKKADVYFPNLDEKSEWEMVKKSETMNEDGIEFNFCIYENSKVQIF